MRADLHIHTYYSDGLQSPEDVATIAKNNGVELIAITDHDTALAYPEIFSHCEKRGIKAVYGIEVSAYSNGVRLHTLGYGINPEHPIFKKFTEELVEGSFARTEDVINKLKSEGIKISFDDVLKHRRCEKAPIHSMYIARAGVQNGYLTNPFEFQKKYLSGGCIGYSEVGRPSPERAVEVITACGGLSSLAHPGRIELEKEEVIALIEKLVGLGLKGIEAYHSAHTPQETAYFIEVAKKYGLFFTGGSDTHFKEGNKKIGTPVFDCGEELCEKLGIKKQN